MIKNSLGIGLPVPGHGDGPPGRPARDGAAEAGMLVAAVRAAMQVACRALVAGAVDPTAAGGGDSELG
jgi:hypothetical protein